MLPRLRQRRSPLLPARQFSSRAARRAAFTLIELMLALGLAVFVLSVVGMAIDMHLRALDTGRSEVEEAQLARALLGRIADDLRNSVQYDPVVGSSGSGSSGSGSSGSGSSNGAGSSGSTSGSSTSGTGSSGTGSSGTGSSGTSGSSSTSDGSSDTSESDSSTTSSSSEGSIVANSTPGVYGNEYQLQVDVSRPPRPDQQQLMLAAVPGDGTLASLGDIKTVLYFLADPSSTSEAAGLYRSEMPRATAVWAAQQGTLTANGENLQPLAPEVASLEFYYYDGTQWVTEWDTSTSSALPRAVHVILGLWPTAQHNSTEALRDPTADVANANLHYYQTIVYLPAAHTGSGAGSGSSSSSSSSSSTSQGSGDSSSRSSSSSAEDSTNGTNGSGSTGTNNNRRNRGGLRGGGGQGPGGQGGGQGPGGQGPGGQGPGGQGQGGPGGGGPPPEGGMGGPGGQGQGGGGGGATGGGRGRGFGGSGAGGGGRSGGGSRGGGGRGGARGG